jgi:hypothetical protein
MARMMVPFRRTLGYSFDTDAFLNDETYAKIILDEAANSSEVSLQNLAKQFAQLYMQVGQPSEQRTGDTQPPNRQPPDTQQPHSQPFTPTRLSLTPEADAMRAELIRKYKGGIR